MPRHVQNHHVFELGDSVQRNILMLRNIAKRSDRMLGPNPRARDVLTDEDGTVRSVPRPVRVSSENADRMNRLADLLEDAKAKFSFKRRELTQPYVRALNNALYDDGILVKRAKDDYPPHDRGPHDKLTSEEHADAFDRQLRSSRNNLNERDDPVTLGSQYDRLPTKPIDRAVRDDRPYHPFRGNAASAAAGRDDDVELTEATGAERSGTSRDDDVDDEEYEAPPSPYGKLRMRDPDGDTSDDEADDEQPEEASQPYGKLRLKERGTDTPAHEINPDGYNLPRRAYVAPRDGETYGTYEHEQQQLSVYDVPEGPAASTGTARETGQTARADEEEAP